MEGNFFSPQLTQQHTSLLATNIRWFSLSLAWTLLFPLLWGQCSISIGVRLKIPLISIVLHPKITLIGALNICLLYVNISDELHLVLFITAQHSKSSCARLAIKIWQELTTTSNGATLPYTTSNTKLIQRVPLVVSAKNQLPNVTLPQHHWRKELWRYMICELFTICYKAC